MSLENAVNHGGHGEHGGKTRTKELLECPSPRRKPGPSSLNFLDSGVRRNDESAINQRVGLSDRPVGDTAEKPKLTVFAVPAVFAVVKQGIPK